MPIDGDVTVGPSVTLDGTGNALFNFTTIAVPGDGSILLITAGGVQYLVPASQVIGGSPGAQAASGTLNVAHQYARSQGWI